MRKMLLLGVIFFHCLFVHSQAVSERMIYVPLQDWENVIKTSPKGVRISYQEYLDLLKKQEKEKVFPPARIVIDNVEYEGKIEHKTLQIRMSMWLTVLEEGPQSFEFHLGEMGVQKITLDNQEALITAEPVDQTLPVIGHPVQEQNTNDLPDADRIDLLLQKRIGYRVLISGKGRHLLQMDCHKKLELKRDELKGNIVLGNFPRQAFVLKSQPDVEYITVPAGHPKGNGDLNIDLGKASSFSLTARPKEKKDEKQPLVVAHIEEFHLVKDDAISSLFTIHYDVHYRPQKTFTLLLPPDFEIVSISENRWQTQEEAGQKILTIQTEKEIVSTHTLSVKLEKQSIGNQKFDLPQIEPMGNTLFRQDGTIYIGKSKEIDLELLDVQNVQQTDPQKSLRHLEKAGPSLPSTILEGEPFGAFKFWDKNRRIHLGKKIISGEMESTSVSAVSIYQDALESSFQIVFDVLQGKVPELSVELPEGWILSSLEAFFRDVSGNEKPLNTSGYYIKNRTLYLPLQSKIIKGEKVRMVLALQCMPEKWQTRWEKQEVVIPFIKPLNAKFRHSFMGLIVDPDYQMDVKTLEHAMSVDLNVIRNKGISSDNLALGLKLTNLEAKIAVFLTAKKTNVSVLATHYILVESERIRCCTVLVYDVKNASTDTFRFHLPPQFPHLLNISDKVGLIKEKQVRANPKQQEWVVKLQRKVLGGYSLYLAYEISVKESQARFSFDPLVISDVEQIKGFLGISASSEAEITLESKGLSGIPAIKLPILDHPELPVGRSFLHTFQYASCDFGLTMDIKVHQKANVATAILEEVSLSTLYPQADQERVTGEYKLSHRGLQFFVLVLPKGADFWSVVVDGEGEKPLKKGNGISIPLRRHADGRANQIKVVYQRSVPPLGRFGHLHLERPLTEENIPIKKMKWFLSLPPDYKIGRFEEFRSEETPWYTTILDTFLGTLDRPVRLAMKTRQTSYGYEQAPYAEAPNEAPSLMPTKPRPQLQTEDWKSSRRRRQLNQNEIEKEGRIGNNRLAREEMKAKIKTETQNIPGNEFADAEQEEELAEGKEEIQKMEEFDRRQESPKNPEPQMDYDEFQPEQKPMEPSPSVVEPEKPSDAPTSDIATGQGGSVNDKVLGPDTSRPTDTKKIVVTQKPVPLPVKKAPLSGERDMAGVASVKVQGARSIEIELETGEGEHLSQSVSPSASSVSVFYFGEETARSLELLFMALSLIAGTVLLLQHRVPRLPVFLGAIVVFTFIPHLFGISLLPYCNALVFGLLLSIPLLLAYKLLWKIGGWLRLRPAFVLLPLVALSFLYAQERETTQIYVPYDASDPSRIQQPQEVFVPYETYVRLWNNAYPDRPIGPRPVEEKAPFYLHGASYEGKVVENRVELNARFSIVVEKGPAVVPLGLMGTAIKKAHLYKGKQGPLTIQPTDKGYRAVLEEPGRYEIHLDLFIQGETAQKRGKFTLEMVPVAASVFQFSVDPDIEVKPGDFKGDWYEQSEAACRRVVIFPGLRSSLDIEWSQIDEKQRARGLNITATSLNKLRVENNLLKLHTVLDYEIISGSVDRLSLKMPDDYTIISLSCTGMERWTLSPEKADHLLGVRLLDASRRVLRLEIVAEKPIGTLPSEQRFPRVVPLEASRENGQAVLMTDGAYHLSIQKHLNLNKISSHQEQDHFVEVFRHTDHPYELVFTVRPQILNNFASSFVQVKIDEEKMFVECRTELEIRGKELFSYQVVYPSELEVTGVKGKKVARWRTEKIEGRNVLYIPFTQSLKKGEKVSLDLSFERAADFSKPLDVPRFFSPHANYQSGTILLHSMQDLNVSVSDAKGMEERDVSPFPGVQEYKKRYAFRFEGTAYQGNIHVHPKKAEVEADVLLNLFVEDDWINWGYFFDYKIKFAAVDTFEFRLPAAIGENIDILGENIKEKRKSKVGQEWIWQIVLHNKVRERYTFSVFPPIVENQAAALLFHPVRFPISVHHRLYVLVQNDSQNELVPGKIEGLGSINPSQVPFLPPKTSSHNFILSYRMERADWELALVQRRQKVVHTTTAGIDTIKIDTIIDREGVCRNKIMYNLRHSGLQFLEIERIGNIDIWGVFISDRFVMPVKRVSPDGKERLLIPLRHALASGTEEERISIRLIYSQQFERLDKAGPLKLSLPLVNNVKEIGQVGWTVYLPKEYLYKFGGNITSSRPLDVQEYRMDSEFYAKRGKRFMEMNKSVIQSAISNTNRLKHRQGGWLEEQEKEQQKKQGYLNISPDVQGSEQYANQDISGSKQVLQSPRLPEKEVYRDKKSQMLAGENNDVFLGRQIENAQKALATEPTETKATISYYTFDLGVPDGKRFDFAKKQGDAVLEIRCYVDPYESPFWRTVQFLIFLGLIFFTVYFKLFSLEDGYSFRKFWLTLGLMAVVLFSCYFLEWVHYFYL